MYIAICNWHNVWLIAGKVTLRTYSFIAYDTRLMILLRRILVWLAEN